MPRLFVKNLPEKITEDKLRGIFQKHGKVTDCTLKYSKDGIFRKFAFVGFKSEEEAQNALENLNKSFIQQSRIEVQFAVNSLSDKPKPQGRHSFVQVEKPKPSPEKKKKKKKEKSSEVNELEDDPTWQEFMALHNIAGTKKHGAQQKGKPAHDADSSSEDEDDDREDEKAASSDEDSDESDEEETASSHVQTKGAKKTQGFKQKPEAEPDKKKAGPTPHVLKMRRLWGKYDEKKIMDFFKPLVPVTVRLPRNARHRLIGVAYVSFKDENELDQALRKNKNFINGKSVLLKKGIGQDADEMEPRHVRSWEAKEEISSDVISDTGRLYLRNLPYTCTEDDLEALFKPFGLLTEVSVPFDKAQDRIRGYAFITFMMPQDAVKAYMELDGTDFQGRLLHILPGKEKVETSEEALTYKEKKKKQMAGSSHTWNALFVGTSAVTNIVARDHLMETDEFLNLKDEEGLAVKLALGETDIVQATRKFLLDNDVALDSFSQAAGEKSKTTILVKDLPADTSAGMLRDLFGRFGELSRVLLPPSGVTAIVEFVLPTDARTAFRKLVGTLYHDKPLYLQWAPVHTFTRPARKSAVQDSESSTHQKEDASAEKSQTAEKEAEAQSDSSDSEDDSDADAASATGTTKEDSGPNTTIFVKNLNFSTTDEELEKKFRPCGNIVSATIVKKQNPKNPEKLLSAGYGFVTFKTMAGADRALKDLQHCLLDNHHLELKRSQKTAVDTKEVKRKKQVKKKQNKSTKILVRNVPFQATKKELTQIFSKFGTLNFVRLPKKMAGTGAHRGFAFVDYFERTSAKKAFKALCHSTHLYGRRLVLEWADSEETLADLQRKTAQKFSDDGPRKKFKKSDILTTIG